MFAYFIEKYQMQILRFIAYSITNRFRFICLFIYFYLIFAHGTKKIFINNRINLQLIGFIYKNNRINSIRFYLRNNIF